MYAGDIFDMNDGETDAEKRHIFLEKHICARQYTLASSEDNLAKRCAFRQKVAALDNKISYVFDLDFAEIPKRSADAKVEITRSLEGDTMPAKLLTGDAQLIRTE